MTDKVHTPRPDLAVVELRDWLRERERLHLDGELYYEVVLQYRKFADALDALLAERAAHAIPDGWKLVPVEPAVTLAECPVGLFLSAYGELCLKTEYGNNQGRIDAYIVSSGEFFWGGQPQTISNQRVQKVMPMLAAAPQPKGPEDE